MPRASARSSVSSWMFQAIRKGRAPTSRSPGRRVRPRSARSPARRRVAVDERLRDPRTAGRRMSARTTRSARVAARAYRYTGSSIAVGQPGPERRASPTQVVHARVAERHEGCDIERTDARVPALLVLACRCARWPALASAAPWPPTRPSGEPAKVSTLRSWSASDVRSSKPDPGRRLDGPGTGVDDLGAPPVADVGDALDAACHRGQHGRVDVSTRPAAGTCPIGYHGPSEPTQR